jgi:mercuric ion transport protein
VKEKKMLRIGIIGTIVTLLCCVTPVLVLLLGIVGLGVYTGYLDYVLFPVLAMFLAILIYSNWKSRKKSKKVSNKM